jgi:TonB family protein
LFEFFIPAESAPQSPRSFAASIVAHIVIVILLFAIRFSGVTKFPAAPAHYTLIAPARETPIRIPKVSTPRPREFRPLPPTPVHLELRVAIMSAPATEIPKPVIPEIPFAVSVPAIPNSVQASKVVVKAAGFESSEASASGPARGTLSAIGSFESAHSAQGAPARSAIARAGGFSDASAPPTSMATPKVVMSAAFGDTTVEKGAAAPRRMAAAGRLTPVEILSKPKPAFTAEARAKHIEGEVLLEVQFNAAGDVRVLNVVRGLGCGLDENAVAAAQGIRFRPATRDGAVVDSSALVHIVFQLAN